MTEEQIIQHIEKEVTQLLEEGKNTKIGGEDFLDRLGRWEFLKTL